MSYKLFKALLIAFHGVFPNVFSVIMESHYAFKDIQKYTHVKTQSIR